MTDNEVEQLIEKLTLEEKVSLLAGADLWHTTAIKRLGIPPIKLSDGPVGVRGSQGSSSPRSACFPAPVAMGATWNPILIEQVGRALGEEVKVKGAHILLAPMVNIHRSPLAGRHFECYAEDPYLTARMAVATINGLQSEGVGACIKHIVCNDSEFERMSISSEVDERTLREIYLMPFEVAVREARPWAVMSAYNKVNGTYCSENDRLLLDILKDEWGFDGLVISDWAGTYSDRAAHGGLDLEMPGPARWMGTDVLLALENGAITECQLDDKVRRLLNTIQKAGAFQTPDILPEGSEDKPEYLRLARQVAGESIVLLKNDGLLPLDLGKLDSITVIGENARWAQVMGGGSAEVVPHYTVSPLDGIRKMAADDVEVTYALGCPIHKSLPLIDMGSLVEINGARRGFTLQLFDNCELLGEPRVTTFFDRAHITWSDELLTPIPPAEFSARLSATIRPGTTGGYAFGLTGNGIYRLSIDGEALIDNWQVSEIVDEYPWGKEELTADIKLEAGVDYQLSIEYGWRGFKPWRMLRLGCWPPTVEDPIGEAVALAAGCDVALVFAGLTSEWESEGYDRADMHLRGDQDELIRRVAEANPNTIVVLNTGAPVTMDWLDEVPAVLQSWYGGQETGNAIADVLFGDVNPSGKLPTTFPRRLEDNPTYINYPGENGKVHYGEGVFVGYRYYDKKLIEPLFPFGHGLSYTSFVYSSLSVDKAEYTSDDQIYVSLDVQNTGRRPGAEVVQLYVRDVECSLMRPDKELKAFEKILLEAGELKTVTFTLDRQALSFYDPSKQSWVAESGEFEVLLGSSSRDIRLAGRFALI